MIENHISLKGLSFSYGGADVLKDISLDIQRGRLTVILGPNGSGKSTLLRLISGYLEPKKGSVEVGGRKVRGLSPEARAGILSFSGDEPPPSFGYSVEETVKMGRIGRGGHEERHLLSALGSLDLLEKRLRGVDSLSSGERQRVFLARSFYQDGDILLLDEPTSHLDMAYEVKVMERVKSLVEEEGKTALVVLHQVNLGLRYAQRLIFMKEGRILHDIEPGCLTPKIIEEVYEVSVSLFHHPKTKDLMIIP